MVDLFGLKVLKEAILATLRKKKTLATKDSGTRAAKKVVKLITIPDGNIDGAYENSKFCFAACSDIENGSVKQLFTTAGCREGVIANYRRCVTGKDNANAPSKRRTSLMVWIGKGNQTHPHKADGSSGRMNITYGEYLKKCMDTAVLILNALEKRNKWLRTQVYETTHSLNKSNVIYYFRGSRWWQYAPHTLSMYMLIIRLSKHPNLHKLRKNSSVDTIIKAITSINSGNDSGHAKTAGNWVPLLDNRKTIYKGRELVDNWNAVSSGSEGIRRLTDQDADDKQTLKRFKEVLAKK